MLPDLRLPRRRRVRRLRSVVDVEAERARRVVPSLLLKGFLGKALFEITRAWAVKMPYQKDPLRCTSKLKPSSFRYC